MKLSQAILISLTLLICFSPTLSLAMQVADINDIEQGNTLVERLKNKNIKLFVSINDRAGLKNNIKLSKKISKFFKSNNFIGILCWLSFFVDIGFIMAYSSGDVSNFIGITYIVCFSINMLLCFFIALYRSYKLRNCIESIYQNNLDNVKYYLSQWYCMPDNIAKFGNHALYECFDNGNQELMIITLLKHKDFDYFNASNYITIALCKNYSEEVIELLFDKGGKFILEDFCQIIKKASLEKTKFLVDLGIDVNSKDENGTPAIITAVLNEKLEVIDLLLSRFVDIWVKDAQGKTVMDYLNDPEIENPQIIREKLQQFALQFRQRIADQVYQSLEQFSNFGHDESNMISEYLV